MFFVLLHKILQVHRFSSTKMKVLLGKFVSLLSRYFLEFCTEPKSQGICTEERQAFFKKNKTCHFNASFSAMNSVLKVLWFYRTYTEERRAFFKKNKTCHFNASFSAMNSVLKVLGFYRSDLLQEMTKKFLEFFNVVKSERNLWSESHTKSIRQCRK